MEHNNIYAYVMRGELAKAALANTPALSRHSSSDILSTELIGCLSLDLLDDEKVAAAKLMATVYTAIAAFENMVREFISKTMLEHKGENWWEECVSERIRKKAEGRKREEEKIRWHTPRGVSLFYYTDFGELGSIMNQNVEVFEVHIVSIEWAHQIFQTIERSRNVIMHSGELSRRDIERVGTNIRDWINQVG